MEDNTHKKYFFVYTDINLNSFKEYIENISNKTTTEYSEETEDHISKFYEMSKIENIDELTKRLKIYFSLKKEDELYNIKRCDCINKIIEISKIDDKTIRESLCIDINGFSNSKKRYILYEQIKGENKDDLIKFLNSLPDSKVKNIKEFKKFKEMYKNEN